jgi:hypothetical protein
MHKTRCKPPPSVFLTVDKLRLEPRKWVRRHLSAPVSWANGPVSVALQIKSDKSAPLRRAALDEDAMVADVAQA